MSPVKLSAEAFRKDDQRVLKNKYSNNSSVATSSAVSLCARLLVRFHTCSKLQIFALTTELSISQDFFTAQ
jgi:hypothetical protein